MNAALKAISEPRRRSILSLVWDAERAAGDIASRFDVSHAAISQHLRVLKEAGLVSERRDGRRRLYRARKESVAEIRSYLETFWDDAFERLRVEVETENEGGHHGKKRDRS
jgi:DNA-binding transcriptional ArsR family regulator